MNCNFEEINDVYKCSICGFQINKSYVNSIPKRMCSVTETSPNLITKAKNFAKAMVDYAKSGFENVTDEEKNKRLEICGKCEHFSNGTCKLCHCNMKFKTMIASSHCPIEKW